MLYKELHPTSSKKFKSHAENQHVLQQRPLAALRVEAGRRLPPLQAEAAREQLPGQLRLRLRPAETNPGPVVKNWFNETLWMLKCPARRYSFDGVSDDTFLSVTV